MKRCPECRRDYYDETLNYCLDDGTRLLEGPLTGDENTIRMGVSSSDARGYQGETDVFDSGTLANQPIEKTTLKYPDSPPPRPTPNRKVPIIGFVGILALAAAAFGIYKFSTWPTTAKHFASPQNLNLTRLTTSGTVSDIAMSPDGKYVAYVIDESNKRSIRLRQTATTSDVEIVPGDENQIAALSFMPDGNYLYFLKFDGTYESLYQVPVLGGQVRKIAFDVDSAAAVSPDGKQIAFSRISDDSTLILANADGSNQQLVARLEGEEAFEFQSAPSWSPDGRSIAIAARLKENNAVNLKLINVGIMDGGRRLISRRNWSNLNQIAWLKDGDLLVCGNEAMDAGDSTVQIWLIAPNGEERRVTNDLNNYYRASVTADGNSFVTLQSRRIANLWLASGSDPKQATQVAPASTFSRGLQLANSGNIIYSSRSGGSFCIWTMNADGTTPRQVSANQGDDFNPQMTPDGKFIAFSLVRGGTRNVWRMDADGGNLKQLTSGMDDALPSISADGKWVVYETRDSGKSNIYRVSIDGGTPVQLTTGDNYFHVLSPRDGTIAYLSRVADPNEKTNISIISMDGGQPIKTFQVSQSLLDISTMQFSPDGMSLDYIDSRNGGANIWAMPIDGKGEAKPLTDFKSEKIYDFAWSADGKRLAVVRGSTVSDAILVSDLK